MQKNRLGAMAIEREGGGHSSYPHVICDFEHEDAEREHGQEARGDVEG